MKRLIDNLSDDELVAELEKRGLFDKNGLVKDGPYGIGVKTLPIICVDLILVKKNGPGFQIGVIERVTGSQAGKLAVIGGRIKKDQSIKEAIGHHLQKDLKIIHWRFWFGNTEFRPFYVQQYFQQESSCDGYGFDPTKHAIALTYLVESDDEPQPRKEAGSLVWLTEAEVPAVTAYDHGKVMKQAFASLKSVSR